MTDKTKTDLEATKRKNAVKTEKINVEEILQKVSTEKVERFKRVAEHRVNAIIDRLAMLGRIAENKSNYTFTEEQLEVMFGNIETFTEQIRLKFYESLKLIDVKEEFKVSL